MTPEQAQYLDEVAARANRALDTPERSSDTTQSLVEMERLTALVRAYAGAWEHLEVRVALAGRAVDAEDMRLMAAMYGVNKLS